VHIRRCHKMATKLLPPPQPDEVVTSLGKQVQVRGKVESFRFFGAIAARTQTVVEVVVDMGSGEIDSLFRSIRSGEVTGIRARGGKPAEWLRRHELMISPSSYVSVSRVHIGVSMWHSVLFMGKR
jgi:hypothetical protein